MASARWNYRSRPSHFSVLWSWFLPFCLIFFVRLSKKTGIVDCYSLFFRPFWPGSAQREWLQKASNLEKSSRLLILEADNRRLRSLLGLARSKPLLEPAPVICRDSSCWWEQLQLGKGSLSRFHKGNAVLGPGGLIGHLVNVTPTTATVQLLTDPNSQLGVCISRTHSHGLLLGRGMAQPILRFLEKDPNVRPGDIVTTSPYSVLVPPNLPVGVIQSVNHKILPVAEARVKLFAPVAAIDWVQVQIGSE
uniref:Cell shape-determining protein MreC n=1 Tax=Paulinella micropora TaxID=1928728 RepID=A0A385I0E8_9EUKA|nr:putative rod shape-determining protein [Paulinella micropora]AXY63397.1 putative rod shape-determining protein [Paulinella micropora]